MPSPVAHGLAGLVLASIVRSIPVGHPQLVPTTGVAEPQRAALVLTGALMFAACAPDLDFLPGILIGNPDRFHRGPSHSLLIAMLVGVSTWLLGRFARLPEAGRIGVAMTLAVSSHAFLDMFTTDPLRFNGVPLLWPITGRHLMLPAPLFLNIERDPDAPGFIASLLLRHNVHALLRECLVMGALLAVGRFVAGLSAVTRPDGNRATVVGRDRHLDSPS